MNSSAQVRLMGTPVRLVSIACAVLVLIALLPSPPVAAEALPAEPGRSDSGVSSDVESRSQVVSNPPGVENAIQLPSSGGVSRVLVDPIGHFYSTDEGIWWRWTPAASGVATLSINSTDTGTGFTAFATGPDGLPDLSYPRLQGAANGDGSGNAEFELVVEASTEYWISVIAIWATGPQPPVTSQV